MSINIIPPENLSKPYICKDNNPRISRNGNNNWSLGVGVRCEYPHLIWFTLAYESWEPWGMRELELQTEAAIAA